MIDLVIIIGLTILVFPLSLLNLEVAQVIVGAPAVLIFPGYGLAAVLYPQRDALSPVERIALSIGFSIALIPLFALALDLTPWGLARDAIIGVIVFWNLGSVAAAWFRRRTVPSSERDGLTSSAVSSWLRSFQRLKVLASYIVVATGVVVFVGIVAWKLQDSVPAETFTEFYILGTEGKARDYPTSLQAGKTHPIIIGVVNHEGTSQTYRVVVLQGDTTVGIVDPLVLGIGQSWESPVDVKPAIVGAATSLEFYLFREPQPEPYRTLRLVLDVTE